MVRFLTRFGTTALASALLMPASLPLMAHAQQTGQNSTTAQNSTTPKTKKKARHKSAAVPANSGSRPDPLDPHGSPEPPIPTTQGPPPTATRPSTNTPVAPH
jgi:hypothetical protein